MTENWPSILTFIDWSWLCFNLHRLSLQHNSKDTAITLPTSSIWHIKMKTLIYHIFLWWQVGKVFTSVREMVKKMCYVVLSHGEVLCWNGGDIIFTWCKYSLVAILVNLVSVLFCWWWCVHLVWSLSLWLSLM
jgi:hypothetical protein